MAKQPENELASNTWVGGKWGLGGVAKKLYKLRLTFRRASLAELTPTVVRVYSLAPS